MPEPLPWERRAQERGAQPMPQPAPQPQPQPQPWPGFPTGGNPVKNRERELREGAFGLDVRRAGNEDIRTGLAVEDAARDERRVDLQEAKTQAELDAAASKKKARELTGGVETTVEENKAAGLTYQMQGYWDLIRKIEKENPEAIRPSLQEIAASTTGSDFLTNAAIPPAVRSARIQLNNLYTTYIQNAIYQASGAAFQQAELDNLIKSVQPNYWDDQRSLDNKRRIIEIQLGAALLKTGAARGRVEEALAAFRQSTDGLFTEKLDRGTPQETKLSGDTMSVPVPPEYQNEYEAKMRAIPRGSLTLEQYVGLRRALDEKYGRQRGDYFDAQKFVDAYNQGNASLVIPAEEKKLEGGLEKTAAAAAADPGLVGTTYNFGLNAANAGGMGLPTFLADPEGRTAMVLANQKHPNAAFWGDVAGSMAPGAALEGVAGRKLGPIGAEVLGNMAYGGARGAAEADPGESRLLEALKEAGIGGAGAVGGRAAVRGATGFVDPRTQSAIDNIVEPKSFPIPGDRPALPVDDITPANMQAMSDDELRLAIEEAKRGQGAWDSYDAQTRQGQLDVEARNALANQAYAQDLGNAHIHNAGVAGQLDVKIDEIIAANKPKHDMFLSSRGFDKASQETKAQILRMADENYPLTREGILRANPELENLQLKDLPQAPEPEVYTPGATPEGPSRDILGQRISRIEEYLAQDPTPKVGTIPGTDATTMQRAGAATTEEAMQGFPGIAGAREKALESWNRQNSARVLSYVGEELPKDVAPGQDMNAAVNRILSGKYETLRPQIKGRVDQEFNNRIAAIREKAIMGGPGRAELWAEIEPVLNKFRKADGTFDGEGYREFTHELRRRAELWGKSDDPNMGIAHNDMAAIAEDVRKAGQLMIQRANPAVGKQLKAVERAWAHQARIDLASRGAAKATRGVYSPDEYLSAIERMDTSKGKRATSRGKAPDQKYAQDARDVLGGKPAKRASVRETFIGGATLALGGPVVKAIGGALGLSYTSPTKRLVQAILANKGNLAADAVRKVSKGHPELEKFLRDPKNQDKVQRLVAQALRVQGSDELNPKE